jgi:hypothetical protein
MTAGRTNHTQFASAPRGGTHLQRQSGRTTRRILDAPKGAMFVWCDHHLHYPTGLTMFLGRTDITVVSPAILSDRSRALLRRQPVILDHAFGDGDVPLTDEQRHVIGYLGQR